MLQADRTLNRVPVVLGLVFVFLGLVLVCLLAAATARALSASRYDVDTSVSGLDAEAQQVGIRLRLGDHRPSRPFVGAFAGRYAEEETLGANETSSQPLIEYPVSSDFVVLELTRVGMLSLEPEQRPFLRIYGDGRVHLRRNPYLRRDPGDFEAYLSHSDLRDLLSLCATKGLMEFDRSTVEREHEAAVRARQETGSVPGSTDASTTTLVIRLARYAPAGSDVVTEGFQKTLDWEALSDVVSWYPELKALARFQEFVDVLNSIEDATIDATKRDELAIWLPAPIGEQH